MDATVSRESIWQLISSMSRDNQEWLAEKLHNEMAHKKEETLKPYTMEELNARIEQSRADFKAGRTYSSEEVHQIMQEYIASL